ncbi:hypothetical protein TSMEX_005738 [Taenia solium]|eukprot:TsM_000517300 transcript=TsM_000517300 gene=TsM_000517300
MEVYDHYMLIHRLVTALEDDSEPPDFSSATYDRFPPNYEMFSSLALLAYITDYLRCEKTLSGVAMRMWVEERLPRNSCAHLQDDEVLIKPRSSNAVAQCVNGERRNLCRSIGRMHLVNETEFIILKDLCNFSDLCY